MSSNELSPALGLRTGNCRWQPTECRLLLGVLCCSSGGGLECLAQGAGNSTVCCKRNMKARRAAQVLLSWDRHRATGRTGQCGRPEPNRVRAGLLCAVSFARSSQNPSTSRRSKQVPRSLPLAGVLHLWFPSLPPGVVCCRARRRWAPIRSGVVPNRGICGLAGPASGTWGGVSDSSSVHAALLSTALPSSPRSLPPGV